jgi:hypothetical protein
MNVFGKQLNESKGIYLLDLERMTSTFGKSYSTQRTYLRDTIHPKPFVNKQIWNILWYWFRSSEKGARSVTSSSEAQSTCDLFNGRWVKTVIDSNGTWIKTESQRKQIHCCSHRAMDRSNSQRKTSKKENAGLQRMKLRMTKKIKLGRLYLLHSYSCCCRGKVTLGR